MTRRLVSFFVLVAMLASAGRAGGAVSTRLATPAVVRDHLDAIRRLDGFRGLPESIIAGEFKVDGNSAAGWKIAAPGQPFNAADAGPNPDLPARRLIFAACDTVVCIVHYERGGIAHFYEILAFAKTERGWSVAMNAIGSRPLANLTALGQLLRGAPFGWNQQSVAGDY